MRWPKLNLSENKIIKKMVYLKNKFKQSKFCQEMQQREVYCSLGAAGVVSTSVVTATDWSLPIALMTGGATFFFHTG